MSESQVFCRKCSAAIPVFVHQCPECGSKNSPQTGASPLVIGFRISALVVIILLSLIALPNFFGASIKSKNAIVKANMRTLQIAVESYAEDHEGLYPQKIDKGLKSYFPGGSRNGKEEGSAPKNPFTDSPEWPVMGVVTDVESARNQASERFPKGTIEYSVICDQSGRPTSYAIRGSGTEGLTFADSARGGQLVLSNH